MFKTLYDADNTLISQIAGITPSYDDPWWGFETFPQHPWDLKIEADDFNTSSGRMSWWGAIAFANYLNSISYGGSDQWRLPTSNAIEGNNGTVGNELGQLYYNELNALAYPGTGGRGNDFGILGGGYFSQHTSGTAGPFVNAQAYAYWSNMEHAQLSGSAWGFYTSHGVQADFSKTGHSYAWPVSPGQVSAIPVPGALWLMGTALLGLLGLKMRISY